MKNETVRYYDISGVGISVRGQGKYADAFMSYFKPQEVPILKNEPLLEVFFEDTPDRVSIPVSYYSLSGKIAFNEEEFFVKKKDFLYSVSNLFQPEKTVILKLCCTRRTSLKNWVLNLAHSNNVGVTRSEDKFVDSIMNYEVFWYIFAILLMRQKKVFVHSGIVDNDGKAIVIGGTGGCGKTSTLLAFLQNKRFKYVAEDFGIMGSNGITYYTPKKIAIYQSDAKYKNPDVVSALKRINLKHQLLWNFFRVLGMNPRFRFTPEQLFNNERIIKESEIDCIIYMSRVSEGDISKVNVSDIELCTKLRYASFRELKELSEILSNIRAVGDINIRNAYPDISELGEEYEKILLNIIGEHRICWLKVPLKIEPQKIIDYILKEM